MRSQTRRLPINGAIVFAFALAMILSGLPLPAVAQESKSDLILPQDRLAEQQLENARKGIEKGDFAAAAAVLRQFISADDDSLARSSQAMTLASIRSQSLQLMLQIPQEFRDRLYAELDRLADASWSAIKPNSPREEIVAIVKRYPGSIAGLNALRWLAASHRDNGRHKQAAIAWSQVAVHPRITQAQRTIALAAGIESLLAAGEIETAEQMAREVTSSDPILIGGKSVAPRDWVAERLRKARSNSLHWVADIPNEFERGLPAIQPAWSVDVGQFAELERSVENLRRYFADQRIPSTPLLRPVIAGNVVLIRSILELRGHDQTSGALLWSIPNTESAGLAKRSFEHNPFRNSIAATWHRKAEADSIFGGLATDGKRIVIVQEPDRSNLEFPNNSASRPAPGGQTTRWNRLCSYQVSTGQLNWQMGGPPTGPADVLGGVSFLGAPLFVDDLLFVVSRRDDELSLMALDRDTGHLRWTISLGTMAPELAESISRRRIACPVVLADSRLICTTACGMLVAVNPTTRTIDWAARYPVLQHDLPVRQTNGAQVPALPDAWWDEWRSVTCLQGDHPDGKDGASHSKLAILASPDSDQLQAFRLKDGKKSWSVPRSGALHLIGISGSQVIVAEATAIRAHDLLTGAVRWRVLIGEISGRATISGNRLIQPRRTGGLAIVDLDAGILRSFLSDTGPGYGNLTATPDGWISQVDQTLQFFPSIAKVRKRVETRADSQPSESATIELARLDLHARDPVAAYNRLAGAESAEGKSLRRDAILTSLRHHVSGRREGTLDPATISAELLQSCDSDEERLEAMRALGNAAAASGDHTEALTQYLNGLDLISTIGLRSIGEWNCDSISMRRARVDRIFLGAIQRLMDDPAANRVDPKSGTTLRAKLEHVLNDRLEKAKQADDPFAVQRLIDRLLPLEWAQRAFLANSTTALYARTLQKAEPQLLALAGSRDRTISSSALEKYSELLTQSGWRVQSESIQRRLLIEHAGTPLSNGQTIAATMSSTPQLTETFQRLLQPPKDPWAPRTPSIERERESRRREDVYQIPVRVQGQAGSLLDQMDITVSRDARKLRFSSAGHVGTWEFTIPGSLQGSSKILRGQFAPLDLLEAFAVGRLLVFRIGSEVFGILPFNELGGLGASHTSLQIDIAPTTSESPSESTWQPEPVRGKPGIRQDGIRLVNSFGQAMEGLSPVRARYFCYRNQAKLIAIDTQTGKRLWERLDAPPHCQVMGDEDHVYLWNTVAHLMQVLSAIDGEVLRQHPWNVSSDDVLMHQGAFQWSVVRKPLTTVEKKDASSGMTVWSREFEANSTPFVMDQQHLGVIVPSGLLQILSADTGSPIGEAMTVELPEKIERVVATYDAHRWYVTISGRVPRLANLQAEHVWGALRTPFVNGWMHGIDRQTATISWRRYLDSESIPLTASKVVPVMVQSWRLPNLDTGTGNSGMGILKMIDLRSGRQILTHREPSLQPYFSVVSNETRESIDVMTEREMFTLNFGTKTPSP